MTDRVLVTNPVSVVPDYLRVDGAARYGGAGSSIYFAHRIVNGGSAATAFDVVAWSDVGWPTTVLSDPNGDGSPFDASQLPPGPVAVGVNGGETPVIVRVDVPAGTRVGDVALVTLRASAAGDPATQAEARSEAIAAIVRVYDDPSRIVNVPRVPACSTAYCLASGLPPSSPGYRFAWRDPSGGVRQVTTASTSSFGDCPDQLALGPSDAGAGWMVTLEHDESGTWVALDSARFEVGDGLEASGLATGPPTLDIGASVVSAILGVRNASFDQPVADVSLRWALLTPDRARILAPDGSFQPYGGFEATHGDTVNLAPGEEGALAAEISGVAFPCTGAYPVEVWRTTACGGESLLLSAAIVVIDDADGDGMARADELLVGLDPTDGDSDDDGVPDGADGGRDSDGDGLVDGLDCDSDDDGLLDGVETGAVFAGAGTDVAAGCFRPDADPTTTTDPRLADTDFGGASDGSEDADGDGLRDAGERDPLDGLDDTTGCAATPPLEITGLRVTHVGDVATLAWDPVADACTAFVVETSEALPAMLDAGAVSSPTWTDAARVAGVRSYLVRGESWLGGVGPDGMSP